MRVQATSGYLVLFCGSKAIGLFARSVIVIGLILIAASAAEGESDSIAPPSPELKERLQLSDIYTKSILVHGFPIVASENVSDWSLREAAFLVRAMAAHNPRILAAMASRKTRLVIMSPRERTTDVPEHADLTPKSYWDRRARGLGATDARPAVSCGEENLLDLEGDPYATENILIHEFAHAMHQMGLITLDPTFDRRLRAAFKLSVEDHGLWKGTYAATNPEEYWAEGVQSWFDCNRRNDAEHNDIATRDQLRVYDPALAAMCLEVYGDGPWRYQKPRQRADLGHLKGLDRTKLGAFAW